MAKKEENIENLNNLKALNEEVNHICEEIKGLREKIYALDKEKIIDDLTKQLDDLKQYKDNYAGLVKHIEENAIKEQKKKWPIFRQVTYGMFGFAIFYAVCAWKLLFFSDLCTEPMYIIGGISILLILAVVLLLLARMTKSNKEDK